MSLTIGPITLKEAEIRPFEEAWETRGRQIKLAGVEYPTSALSLTRITQLHDDILNLSGTLQPVQFGVKSSRNGYYTVDSANCSMVQLGAQNVVTLTWELNLTREGADTEVDLESHLSGPVTRINGFSLTGERWHAPPRLHSAYWSGNSQPAQVVRTGGEGAIKVYRAVDVTANPRWFCNVEDYLSGRVKLNSNISGNIERVGSSFEINDWAIENTLVWFNIGGSSTLDFYFHNGSIWSGVKSWNLTVGGTPLGVPLSTTVIRNTYAVTVLRLLWNVSPSGRVTADLTLRRGSRFVDILIRSQLSATLGVVRASTEAGTSGSGFVRGTSNDADGHRYIVGSALTFTNDLTNGGLSKAAVNKLDAFIGVEKAGSAAVAGDQAANLMAQYLGSPYETVVAVNR